MPKRNPWVIVDLLTSLYVTGPDGKPLRFASERDALVKCVGHSNYDPQYRR